MGPKRRQPAPPDVDGPSSVRGWGPRVLPSWAVPGEPCTIGPLAAEQDSGHQPKGPLPDAQGSRLSLYAARQYFQREGLALGAIVVVFVLQALGVTLAHGELGGRDLLLVPLALGGWLSGLLLSPLRVRRWWREAGEGPPWHGGAAAPLGAAGKLVVVVLLEAFFLPLAVFGGGLVWSLALGLVVTAGSPAGCALAIGREERRRDEVLLVELEREALRLVPRLWLRGRPEVAAR